MTAALLMGILAFINGLQTPISWWVFREPIMAGFWVGLIYGDPVTGVIIGGTINILYLGWLNVGGSNPSDLWWAGLLGTFVAIHGKMSIEQSAAFAVPIGLLGSYVHVSYMTLASFWPTKMDKYAEVGNWRGIRRIQIFGGPLIVLFLRAIPVFLIAYIGSDYIEVLIQSLPAFVMKGLGAVGKILPALGMAMLLKFMYSRQLFPFFIIGFAIAAYTGMKDLTMYVIISIALASIVIKLGFTDNKKKEL